MRRKVAVGRFRDMREWGEAEQEGNVVSIGVNVVSVNGSVSHAAISGEVQQ